jgi:hypothetical protein
MEEAVFWMMPLTRVSSLLISFNACIHRHTQVSDLRVGEEGGDTESGVSAQGSYAGRERARPGVAVQIDAYLQEPCVSVCLCVYTFMYIYLSIYR